MDTCCVPALTTSLSDSASALKKFISYTKLKLGESSKNNKEKRKLVIINIFF